MTRDEAADVSARLLRAVEDIRDLAWDETQRGQVESVAAAAVRLRQVFDRTPPGFDPPAWSLAIEGAFDPVLAALEAFVPAAEEPREFPIGWNEVERLWGALGHFLPAILSDESVAEDAASFRRSAGQLLRRISDEVEAVGKEVADREAELSEIKQQQDEAIARLQEKQNSLDVTITEQATRLEQTLRDHQAEFSESQERQRVQFEEALAGHREALDQERSESADLARARVSDIERAGEEVAARLSELEQSALRSYSTIGEASVSGYFQRHADRELRAANRWRLTAVCVFVVAAVGTLLELALQGGSLSWEDTRSRLLLAIPLSALAGFAVAEARAHRRAERESRRREVELCSLDPYLKLIEDRSSAEAIKLDYARRIFIEQNGDGSLIEPTPHEPEVAPQVAT